MAKQKKHPPKKGGKKHFPSKRSEKPGKYPDKGM